MAKLKYMQVEEQDTQPGQFIQLSSGRYVPQAMPPARTSGKSVKSHKLEVRKPVMRKELPVEETHICPEEINLDEYAEIGVETTDRIAIRPAVMYIDRTVRHKFVLKSSLQIVGPEKQAFVISPLPEMIIPKGMASESLLADILIDKYVYHLPFCRMIQKYKELGFLLSESTIVCSLFSSCQAHNVDVRA